MNFLKWFLIILPLGLIFMWARLRRVRRKHKEWKELLPYRYAHRGLHSAPDAPENSMEAFRRAVEKGYGIELDVHLLEDGELAVIHDSSLLRTAGAEVKIEDLTVDDLREYRLEGTEERIPLLRQVLELVAGQVPLIVELKPAGNNVEVLCRTAAEMLDKYEGFYCVESFDPRCVGWFKTNRPGVCRGQLSENFVKNEPDKLTPFLRFCMTHLLVNTLSQPDFVAYRFEDRNLWSMVLHRIFHRPNVVYWTITSEADLKKADQAKAIAIFEDFEP